MDILLAAIVGIALMAATVAMHYEILRWISGIMSRVSVRVRTRMNILLWGLLFAHFLEIGLYAIAFFLMHRHLGLGSLGGDFGGTASDYVYFSITSYTTLGIGDIYPVGPLRLVAAIEALNGFVLIGWSVSFTYLAMARFWDPQHARP